MKNITYILALAMVLTLPGCEKDHTKDSVEDRRIYLRASVENTAATKTPVMENPSADNQLDVAVWATSTENDYRHTDGANGSGTTSVQLHTKGHFSSTEPQLLADAIYPKQGGTVYFTAFHPQTDTQTDGQTGWTTTNGTDAKFTFTGAEDVMFAPQTSGTYGTLYDNSPTLYFKHMLTLLTFKIKAEDEKVSTAWGEITGFTIKSKGQIQISGLGSIALDDNNNFKDTDIAKITFTGSETDFNVYKGGTNEVFSENSTQAIPYDNDYIEVAYVMCSPVNAIAPNPDDETVNSTDYTITIKTKNRNIQVPIDLKETADAYFAGNTMGWHFTVNILFKMGDKITVSAAVNDWETGGIGSGEING